MSTSLGKLIDEFSILRIRAAHQDDPDIKAKIMEQISTTMVDIDSYLAGAVTGKIPVDELLQPKYKKYAFEDNAVALEKSLAMAVDRLVKANVTLWDLEDQRRDPGRTNEDRLVIMDEVSRQNKLRNDSIDQVDQVLKQFVEDHPPIIDIQPLISQN